MNSVLSLFLLVKVFQLCIALCCRDSASEKNLWHFNYYIDFKLSVCILMRVFFVMFFIYVHYNNNKYLYSAFLWSNSNMSLRYLWPEIDVWDAWKYIVNCRIPVSKLIVIGLFKFVLCCQRFYWLCVPAWMIYVSENGNNISRREVVKKMRQTHAYWMRTGNLIKL